MVMEEQFLPLSRLIVQEVMHRLTEGGFVLAGAPPAPTAYRDDHHSLKDAARMLGHGYFWLSRNYMRLGLRPSRIGGKLLFEREEVERLKADRKVRPAGRPRARKSFAEGWN
jgi:hypothetical protein